MKQEIKKFYVVKPTLFSTLFMVWEFISNSPYIAEDMEKGTQTKYFTREQAERLCYLLNHS